MPASTWNGPSSPWLHRYAALLAACTLLLLLTGPSVSSNEERPLYSFGQIHPWAGASAGILTIGLVIWLSKAEKRAWLRRLGWVILGAVLVESLLGLQTAPQSPAVRIGHAFLAHLIFAGAAAITVFTSRGWKERPEPVEDASPLRSLAKITPALALVQVSLGVAFRHGAMGVGLHILGAFVVALLVLGMAMSVINRPEHAALHAAAKLLLIIASVQVFLGLALFSIGPLDIDPLVVILVTMVHTAMGALTLALTVVVALRVLRHVRAPLSRQAGSSS